MTKLLMRFKYIAVLLALVTGYANAQSTVVSGSLVDSSGYTWSYGTVTAVFQRAPNSSGTPVWSGGTLNPIPASVATDSGGNFSITLPTNTYITPAGSTWLFSFCPNATTQCAVINIPLTTSTFNPVSTITAQGAWPTGQIFPTQISKVYNVAQAGTPPLNQGGMVYNVTNQTMNVYTNSGWTPFAFVGGLPVVTNPSGNQTITQPINTILNFITSGTGAVEVNGNPVLVSTTSYSQIFGILNGTSYAGQTQVNGASVNNTADPEAYGLYSGDSLTTTTGTASASSTSLVVSSSSTFAQYMDLFAEHGGVACGTTRGTSCPTGLTPTVTTGGTAGSATYSYTTRCIDGLGGAGIAGSSGSTTTGNATLSASNYNVLTFTVASGCIELAIYRSGSLIGRRYAIGNGNSSTTVSFYDYGQSTVTLRDVPAASNGTAYADNYVGQITSISGTTWTVNPAITTAISGATIMHSDTPLLQGAFALGNISGEQGHFYIINYPLDMVGYGGLQSFGAYCDTGDICIDATNQQSLALSNVGLFELASPTAPSTVGLYMARDSSGVTTQGLTQRNVTINMGSVPSSGTGQILTEGLVANVGSIAIYDYAAEVQGLTNPVANNEDRLWVFTGNNLFNAPSLFDGNQIYTQQSMSAITITNPTGGSNGPFFTLDQAFSINVNGGYTFGGNSNIYPWGIEAYGNLGDIHFNGYRMEGRDGLMHLFPGATFGSYNFTVNNFQDRNATVAQFGLDAGATLTQGYIFANSLGGFSTQALYSCVSTCNVSYNPLIFVGVGQSWNTSSALQSNNHVFLDNNQGPSVELIPTFTTPMGNFQSEAGGSNLAVFGQITTTNPKQLIIENSPGSNTISIQALQQGSGFNQILQLNPSGGNVQIGTNNAVSAGSPTTGQASCIKATGPPVVIGYCSSVVGAGGACTCN